MVIDFSKLGDEGSSDTALDPREIFFALPDKAPKYVYLRDVQGQVMDGWFSRRNDHDVVLKMNTGAGKTLAGLLILKSCLNERKGPAVYVAPDNYLVNQVMAEAEALRLDATNDVESPAFLRGQAIGVVNIYKLLNGKSVFGVGDEGIKIPIGSLVVDDAHACLATAEEQFTVTADAGTPVYDGLLGLFRQDLEAQSSTKILDVEAQVPGSNMLVPFWAWSSKQPTVSRLLHENRESDELRFAWPLIRSVLPLCQCSFGGGEVEITTRSLPVDAVPSFADAARRIFMTATLADDGVLVTHFDADPSSAERPVTPGSAADLGERMILIPQELNPTITEEDLRDLAKDFSQDQNVVVIVPSKARARLWASRADRTVDASNLWNVVEELKAGHVGLVVLINKYDGVDLPDNACRVLVLDGLPDVRRKLDRIEGVMLRGSTLQTLRLVQRLEQGMGRGTRSAEDHCAVMLMGRTLTGHLYLQGAIDSFSPATKAQFHLSEKISKQLHRADIETIKTAVKLLLDRNSFWVRSAKGALVGARYGSHGSVGAIAKAQRSAFNAARRGDHPSAVAALQDVVNAEPDTRTRGWLRMQLAERMQALDAAQAQKILQAAAKENPSVVLPLSGITYRRLRAHTAQAEASGQRMAQHASPIEFMIAVHDLLDRLQFLPDTAPAFEDATRDLGLLLGFGAQAPESEFGSGPDVLWQIGATEYFVIECKNGATNGMIAKSDANQLAGSMNWFHENYGATGSATPVIIHPDSVLGPAATAPPGMRVVTSEKLSHLKDAVMNFCSGVAAGPWRPTQKVVEEALTFHRLTAAEWLSRFSVSGSKGHQRT
jgi:hypothetical protein